MLAASGPVVAPEDTEAALRRAHRKTVTRRLPRFGTLWVAAASVWALTLHLQGRLALPLMVLVPVLHGAGLAITIVLCRAQPEGRRVLPVVFAACVALAVAAISLFVFTGADGDFLAFALLTLYILAAVFFIWGWPTELALVAVTVIAWLVALPGLHFHVPPEELLAAIAVGVMVSLVVAEGAAQAFAATFRRRMGEQRSRRALEMSRDEADAARVQAEGARAQAEGAAASRDQFLAMLSHELRSPLGAVLTWTRMLRTGLVPEEKVPHALASIEEAAREQTRLVEDILDISRIAAGKFSLKAERVDLRALLLAHAEVVRQTAATKGLTLDLQLAAAEIEVRGDRTRLRQVVENLLSNALKFTSEGGRISVALTQRHGDACLTVTDTGIGIPADVLPHVFERFQQADRSITRRYGGLGLGLTIARHLVELHGGRIEAESAGEGCGATFRLHLPLASDRPLGAAAAPPAARASDPRGAARVLDQLRVLVVDDEARAREVLMNLLGGCGAEVRAVASVHEALESVEASAPDVLLSDLAMPEADGYTLIRRIRALERGRGGRIAAIAVSALASADDRARALAEGYDVHLAKPVEPTELVATIAASARAAT